jgi:hypothetical protein
VFVVRGPAPSCGVVGRFAVRGDRGVNRVRFTGRVGRRTLGPGTYRIVARTPQTTRTIVVSIVEPGSAPAPARFACASSRGTSIFTALAERFDVGGASGSTSASGSTADGANSSRSTGTAAAIAVETPTPKAGEEDSGVLPAITRRVTALPSPLPEAGSPPWILGAVAFGLLVLGALAILAYVVRFLRRPHAT